MMHSYITNSKQICMQQKNCNNVSLQTTEGYIDCMYCAYPCGDLSLSWGKMLVICWGRWSVTCSTQGFIFFSLCLELSVLLHPQDPLYLFSIGQNNGKIIIHSRCSHSPVQHIPFIQCPFDLGLRRPDTIVPHSSFLYQFKCFLSFIIEGLFLTPGGRKP